MMKIETRSPDNHVLHRDRGPFSLFAPTRPRVRLLLLQQSPCHGKPSGNPRSQAFSPVSNQPPYSLSLRSL